MELAPLVELLDDAERRQTHWWLRMVELEDVLRTERRRYIAGELERSSFMATAHAVDDSWRDACKQWKQAKDQAVELAKYMDLTMQVGS